MFSRHVAQLHADGDIGFSKEYEAIQAEATKEDYTAESSDHPENKIKNRYLNITACKYKNQLNLCDTLFVYIRMKMVLLFTQ